MLFNKENTENLLVLARLGVNMNDVNKEGNNLVHYVSIPSSSEIELYEPLKYDLDGIDYHDPDNIAKIAKKYLYHVSYNNLYEEVSKHFGEFSKSISEIIDQKIKENISEENLKIRYKIRDEHWTEEKAQEACMVLFNSSINYINSKEKNKNES